MDGVEQDGPDRGVGDQRDLRPGARAEEEGDEGDERDGGEGAQELDHGAYGVVDDRHAAEQQTQRNRDRAGQSEAECPGPEGDRDSVQEGAVARQLDRPGQDFGGGRQVAAPYEARPADRLAAAEGQEHAEDAEGGFPAPVHLTSSVAGSIAFFNSPCFRMSSVRRRSWAASAVTG